MATQNTENPKILLILEAAGGGAGRHVLDLAGALAGKGFSVYLLYSPLRAEKAFLERLRQLKIISQPIEMARNPGLSDFPALLKIIKYIHANGPFRIIHGHSSKGGALARVAGMFSGAKVVYTPHGFSSRASEFGRYKKYFFAALEKFLSIFTHKIITVSGEEYSHAVNCLKIPKRNLAMIHNGIADYSAKDRFTLRKELGIPENEICLGFIGRLVTLKGLDILLKAIPSILAETPIQTIILGSGEMADNLHKQAESLGISHNIKWLTDISGQELMPAFDIFVMPSRSEAMPYVLLEAAQAGLPIVASRVGGVSAVAHDGVNGILVPPENPASLAEAIIKIASSPELRTSMKENSLKIAKNFSLEKMLDETLKVYEF